MFCRYCTAVLPDLADQLKRVSAPAYASVSVPNCPPSALASATPVAPNYPPSSTSTTASASASALATPVAANYPPSAAEGNVSNDHIEVE